MEQIKIPVYIDQVRAAHEGMLAFGATAYTPTAEEWANVTPEERAWLARRVDRLYPDTGTARWDGIVAAMKAAMTKEAEEKAERAAREAKAAAETEAKASEWLAKPDEAWFYDRGAGTDRWGFAFPISGTYERLAQHPAIIARRKKLSAEVDRRNAEWAERCRLAREAQAKAEEEKKAKLAADKAAELESFKAYATSRGGALARAVADGYDVTRGVVDDVVKQIVEALGPLGQSAIVLRERTKAYDKTGWDARKSPDEHAFAVLDKVTAAVEQVKSPTAMAVSVLKIQRVEYDDGADTEEVFTAVLVELDALVMPHTVVIVRADSSQE